MFHLGSFDLKGSTVNLKGSGVCKNRFDGLPDVSRSSRIHAGVSFKLQGSFTGFHPKGPSGASRNQVRFVEYLGQQNLKDLKRFEEKEIRN